VRSKGVAPVQYGSVIAQEAPQYRREALLQEHTHLSNAQPLHPHLQDGTYSTLALMQAKNGQASDVAVAKANASDLGVESYAFMDFTQSSRVLETGLTYYYQGNHAKTMETLEQRVDSETLSSNYELTSCYEFPWDITRALEVALYRTYCVPSISLLLQKTGESTQHPQKRYDDTALIINEMAASGYDSEQGRVAQRWMNRIHKQYDISNDDYLYVLSVFIYEPVRWLERFGWRKMSEKEKLVSYRAWHLASQRCVMLVGGNDRKVSILDVP
jgi:hypothetical protein